jgi:hypothetical protein
VGGFEHGKFLLETTAAEGGTILVIGRRRTTTRVGDFEANPRRDIASLQKRTMMRNWVSSQPIVF